MEEDYELLPGVPNDITLAHVATKLPWTTFHVLSSVSRVWQRAIQSHEVYDARIRSLSAQTLVAINHKTLGVNAIGLFSIKDDCFYHLPPIPGLRRGVPVSCRCVSVDGKLYVLGLRSGSTEHYLASTEPGSAVYVRDVAGQRQWKQCASMENPREAFACGTIGGKIYVFGGTYKARPVHGSEVYDPKEDAWSPIRHRFSSGFDPHVTAAGEELFVQTRLSHYVLGSYTVQVYHPITNDWRDVDHFLDLSQKRGCVALTIEGKLHKMNQRAIEVFDTEAKSWKFLQNIGRGDSIKVEPIVSLSVDEELLAIACRKNLRDMTRDICILKSHGFGCENKDMVWQASQCSVSLLYPLHPVMCPIRL